MSNFLRVSESEYGRILFSENCMFSYCGSRNFSQGDRVVIYEISSLSKRKTGAFCFRTVVQIVDRFALQLDDEVIVMRLSPYTCGSEPLGLSRDRKSDKIESF